MFQNDIAPKMLDGPIRVYVRHHGQKFKCEYCYSAKRMTSIISRKQLLKDMADSDYLVIAKAGVTLPAAFERGDQVMCNGFAGVVMRQYSAGMFEVRLASGLVCVPTCDIALMPTD